MGVVGMLIVNSQREQRPYVVPNFIGPVISGGGENSFACGKCQTVLLQDVAWSRVQGLAIQCAKCGKLNAVPDEPPAGAS